MAANFVGRRVRCSLAGGSVVEGVVNHVDTATQSLLLSSAVRNGTPVNAHTLTVTGSSIADLTLVDTPPPLVSPPPPPPVHIPSHPVSVAPSPAPHDAAIVSALRRQENQLGGGGGGGGGGARTLTSVPQAAGKKTKKHPYAPTTTTALTGTFSTATTDDCFSQDFDFAANLALFDKKQVFAEIETQTNGSLTGEMTLVEANRRRDAPKKLRPDEMVLAAPQSVAGLVATTIVTTPTTTTTMGALVNECGLSVPCVDDSDVTRLMRDCSLPLLLLKENLARSLSSMVIRLVGGSRRINLKNFQQIPYVAFCVGATGLASCAAVAAARHLANHYVKTSVSVVNGDPQPDLVEQLEWYRQIGSAVVHTGATMNVARDTNSAHQGAPVDLIVDVLFGVPTTPAVTSTIAWINAERAPVVSLGAPGGRAHGHQQHQLHEVDSKWILAYALPTLSLFPTASAALFLADVGIPAADIARILPSIVYHPPFADKFVEPLSLQQRL